MTMVMISPSLLAANFAILGDEVRSITAAGADLLHLDIMDGHFVPNLTFGVPVVKALRPVTKLPFDVHLMVENPDLYVEPLAAAGAEMITVHVEAALHLHRTLQAIKGFGLKAGVALNPATPLCTLEHVLSELDLILLMSVNPGFGGQEFIPGTVVKVASLRKLLQAAGVAPAIAVDGGMNRKTAPRVIAAGADIIVAGSAVFGAPDVKEAIAALRGEHCR
jgi:ribulose-phosphate 3-epimerase